MLDSVDTEYIGLTTANSNELDPDLVAWFDEAIRLFVEASNRAAGGSIRSALSSLAAVPRVHSVLVETCAELLGATAVRPEPEASSPGLHL